MCCRQVVKVAEVARVSTFKTQEQCQWQTCTVVLVIPYVRPYRDAQYPITYDFN